MKFSIFTVIWFSAFFVGPNNAHEKPYVAEAIDPMEHWLSNLEKNAVSAGAFGAFTGNVTGLETIVKLACSTGYISYLNSSHFETLAECAVFVGSPDILQLLFDCGLKFYEDLLFHVIAHDPVKNKADLVETLFKNGGTINLEDYRKYTLLNFAFSFGEIAVMEMLLANGIDVNVRSWDNNTLLHEICMTNLEFRRINSKYLTINDKDYNMRTVPFEMLLSIGADINAINTKGYTPIHLCASSRNLMAAKMLVDAGADVNIQSNKGYTPLFLAFATFAYDEDSQGSAEVIKLLVQNGAVLKENQFYDGIRNDRAFQKYI